MAVEARIRELANRHTALDAALADELKRPSADLARIAELKKHKLKLKDEMLSLRAGA